ncbi:MAG: FtsX-like permease family protein [Acidobacteria bacterium]|nr:FtsX-like permease family protein [Acidobacteriota bacterium]
MSALRHEEAHAVGFLQYCFGEAWLSLRRRWRVASLSTALLAGAVFVLAAALVGSSQLRDVTSRMTEAAELSVYLDQPPDAGVQAAVEAAVRRASVVRAVEVLDPQRATERFLRDFPDLRDVLTSLPERPFGTVVEARLAPGASEAAVDQLVATLRATAGVDDVVYDREVLSRVLLTVAVAQRLATALAVLLALAAGVAVAAVLRLSYYARRDEIEVLGLLGAPSRAVSGPFVVEGLLQALAGTIVAVLLLRVAMWSIWRGPGASWAAALELPDVPFLTWQQLLTLVAGTLLAGAAAGWLASREVAR